MYDFLEALITQQTSPDEAYRKFDAIGNVQFYLVLVQFCTLDVVAKLKQDTFHRKVTSVSLLLGEL